MHFGKITLQILLSDFEIKGLISLWSLGIWGARKIEYQGKSCTYWCFVKIAWQGQIFYLAKTIISPSCFTPICLKTDYKVSFGNGWESLKS